MPFHLQVPGKIGAAQCAHGLRKMHEHLGTQQLSVRQLEIARDLAESLVASLEEVLHSTLRYLLRKPLVFT